MTDPLLSASQDVEMLTADPLPPSTSVVDPASSLRAAALLTLKSKRRKVQAESSLPILPTRPLVVTSLQLDYGQEESSQEVIRPQIVNPPKPTPAPEVPAREEGEISEEEGAPASKALSVTPTPTGRQKHLTPSNPTVPHAETLYSKPKLSERISDPPSVSNYSAFGQGVTKEKSSASTDFPPAPQDPRQLYDADHVRPGVALNQEQYDRAKDVVLDLLGWGVAPEYLVDCGLTREIVYYVFSELNLRLPSNLDITGLVLYSPDHTPQVDCQKSALMPPPPVRRQSQGRSSISSKPVTKELSASPSPVMQPFTPSSKSPVPATLSSPRGIITGNLHDMEQQRRQELLARKAAIASKKSKQSQVSMASSISLDPVASSSPSNTYDPEPVVATEIVEDFLKTIGPSPSLSRGNSIDSNSFVVPSPANDEMDIDDIPGLGSSRQYTSAPTPHPPSSSVELISPTDSSHPPISPNECPPSSTESGSSTFTHDLAPSTTSDTPSITPAPPEEPSAPRRGAKRPVAADFVDFDAGSRPSSNGHAGYTNGMHPGSRRRTGPGFANVTSARRFIIDLSDSEGEGEGEDFVMRDLSAGPKEVAGQHSSYASPIPTKPPVPNLQTSTPWVTTPVSTPTLSTAAAAITPSAVMSPAALVESEIQRMREMIAEREQRRLNKIAAVRSSHAYGVPQFILPMVL
ncbi:hypothetical protein H0H81_003247 [Sphagnurus paluster]|uniref:Uncharacterized protein n=1 Tax=Sphagnurus paluster TaxID=117069 RepID=A0A9P7GLJ5_9AGAR|nr:hypothetical protein H0H81_003247 [Sphagnurus paluster]